jgi:uncharacterized protein (UPF0333 family)
MIFSILIIVVTIAVAFYVIKEFFLTSNCTEIKALSDHLQQEVDTVWRSAAAQIAYKKSLPSSVKTVCFGNPRTWNANTYRVETETFASYRDTENNFFIYPVKCGKATSVRQLSHVSINKGFCVPISNSTLKLTLSKTSSTSGEVNLTP